jgi:hypothetical protein
MCIRRTTCLVLVIGAYASRFLAYPPLLDESSAARRTVSRIGHPKVIQPVN